MGIEDAFLHDILAHPDDDAPRRIYADWLDEHNDPRGEFIHIQCALSQLSPEDPRRWPLEQREQGLLLEHKVEWLPKICGGTWCVFHRGFVEEITLLLEQFLTVADRLFEQAPIRRLALSGRNSLGTSPSDPSLAQVALSGHLNQIQRLRLIDFSLSRRELYEFLASPTLARLTELQFWRLRVESDGRPQLEAHPLPAGVVHDLTELPCRANLTSLHLPNGALTLEGLRLLANSTSLTNLRELNLSNNHLTHEVATVLAESRLLPQLETLDLGSNLLGDAGAFAVREWPALPRLARLNLGKNQIFAAGVQALAKAPALLGLISLQLFHNIGCDAGVAALASANWKHLRALDLWCNGVSDKGVQALAQSGAFSQLTRLDLPANRIYNAGARSLIESPGVPRLTRLDLQRNNIGAAEKRRLRDRFGPFVYC